MRACLTVRVPAGTRQHARGVRYVQSQKGREAASRLHPSLWSALHPACGTSCAERSASAHMHLALMAARGVPGDNLDSAAAGAAHLNSTARHELLAALQLKRDLFQVVCL
jgi:hypothetical protein